MQAFPVRFCLLLFPPIFYVKMIPGSSTDSTAAAQSHRCCAQEPVHSAAAPASAPDVPGDQSKSQPSVPRGAGTVFCEKTYKVKIDDETVWQVPTRLKYVKKVSEQKSSRERTRVPSFCRECNRVCPLAVSRGSFFFWGR